MAQRKALLIDIGMCIGCNACQEGCKEANHLKPGDEDHLSPTAYTALSKYGDRSVRRLCQHCEHPTCASVCPVGAFTKTAEGPVLYDAYKCIGCRYCMQACPFHVPRYEWASTKPRVQKCIFCHERLVQGQPTACSEVCPTGATKFGDREELLQEATKRINGNPGKYVTKIYGQKDVGGTSVFYLSPVPFEQLGFDTELGDEPLPELTMNAMEKIPSVVTVGAVLLTGIWWITKRRTDVARHEAKEHASSQTREH